LELCHRALGTSEESAPPKTNAEASEPRGTRALSQVPPQVGASTVLVFGEALDRDTQPNDSFDRAYTWPTISREHAKHEDHTVSMRVCVGKQNDHVTAE